MNTDLQDRQVSGILILSTWRVYEYETIHDGGL